MNMVAAPLIRTRSEQKLEWFNAERAARPLSEEEWQELGRAEHAIYCRNRRLKLLARHAKEEQSLLHRMEKEARRREVHGDEL